MLKAYKFRLYPNENQEKIISQILGNARFVYNHCLFLKSEKYQNGKQKFSYSDMSKHITNLKKCEEYKWLKAGDSRDEQVSAGRRVSEGLCDNNK